MEYLEGETLSTRLKNGPLPVAETLDVALRIASALSAAHKRGIVHRDLKPGNIMLTAVGPKLLDFGLAKHERHALLPDGTVTAPTTEARVAGTLPYMPPEQLKGLEVDARGDIFAFGAVLYEMLTAIRAFQRRSSSEAIIDVDRENPPPLRSLVKDVPEPLARIVHHCLQMQPEKRFSSVGEIEHGLAALRSETLDDTRGFNTKLLARKLKSPRVALPFATLLLLLVSGSAWWVHHNLKVRWARETALPRISGLIAEGKNAEAYPLAVQAERYIPQNPALQKIWPDISWSNSITTHPPGASVYRRTYNAPNSPWEFVGRTPLKEKRFAAVDTNWKFEMPGYETVERATFPSFLFSPVVITMDAKRSVPDGMVRVDLTTPDGKPPEVGLNGLPGLETSPRISIESYWIDRFEVTNAEFMKFVEQGGYRRPDYWKNEFKKEGHVLSWSDAMELFRDSTGQPGPATWIYAKYPQGEDNYPVTGVSWFEAAAYAEFAGKKLPTIYHWRVAARPTNGASMIPSSNFRGQGLAAVGTYQGISEFGVYDMAGNAKEWVFNEDASGKRFILGGAWNEPRYTFYDADARSPFQRSPSFGFRCVKYLSTLNLATAASPIAAQVRDYNSEKPVSDQLFEAYKSLYSYDKTPLNALLESVKQTDDWKQEKITFDAAYGNERIFAYLFLPSKVKPPYQVVVNFPAAGALYDQSSADLDDYLYALEFIIRSGRAVMIPIYNGTFERGANADASPWPKTTSAYRDRMIMWSKLLGVRSTTLRHAPTLTMKNWPMKDTA
jgi:eukaryotic-like serine/threonine-protein kinase